MVQKLSFYYNVKYQGQKFAKSSLSKREVLSLYCFNTKHIELKLNG